MTLRFGVVLVGHAIVAASVGAITTPAFAWEVNAPDTAETPVRSTPAAPFPFPGTAFGRSGLQPKDPHFPSRDEESFLAPYSSNGVLRYRFKYVHEAHGGSNGSAGSNVSPGLMRCTARPQDGNLEQYGCAPADSSLAVSFPWVNARKSWVDNDPKHAGREHDEHAALTREAASMAGLPPTLGETFWVRYPAANRLIASPLRDGAGWIVGPSWTPLDAASGATSTLRGVTLYELAQMPDSSLAVWDWAASNEICPLDGLDWGFPRSSGDPGNLACHDYRKTIGPLNATHFLPLSKSVYTYYHSLALTRMTECSAMSVSIADYYDVSGSWAPVWSTRDTEVHECEREALVYEMFAQHFLQDAWATGHMWHRWGHTEPSMFPATLDRRYDVDWEDVASVPAENVGGRRALLAGVVASFVGMIHGTKSMLAHLAPDLASAGLLDDPLNGPYYLNEAFVPHPVRWQGANGLLARGAGDLFAHLVLSDSSSSLDAWRNRLLMCSAVSLREIYETGPRAHGPLLSFLGVWKPDEFAFDTECWSQRVTNDSMLGSVLPVGLAYGTASPVPGSPPVGPPVFGIANELVIRETAQLPAMPDEADRERFLAKLRLRMVSDQISTVFDYIKNTEHGLLDNAGGTESARGTRVEAVNGSVEIKFLGVPPNAPLDKSPPASFMDLREPAVPEGDRPQSHFVRRMFWRAHPEDTCEEPGLAARLRDACVAGAEEPGGDPEACTRCVSVAELQMPTCGLFGPFVRPSKCTALGHQNLGGVDASYGTNACIDMGLSDLPAYYGAFHYCTGTDPEDLVGHRLVGQRVLSTETLEAVDCRQFPDYNEHLSTNPIRSVSAVRVRVALSNDENQVEGTSWLPPLVTALVEERRGKILDERALCQLPSQTHHLLAVRTTSSLDDIIESQLSPAPLWDNYATGLRALHPPFLLSPVDPMALEFCGVTQRVSYLNVGCGPSLNAIGRPDLADRIGESYDPATGVEVAFAFSAEEQRCSIREERLLKPFCFEGTCNANGLCTRHSPPAVERWHGN